MGRVPIEPDGAGLPGMVRPAGLDRAQICDVGTRRADAVAKAELANDVAMRASLRQPPPRGKPNPCAAHHRGGSKAWNQPGQFDWGIVPSGKRGGLGRILLAMKKARITITTEPRQSYEIWVEQDGRRHLFAIAGSLEDAEEEAREAEGDYGA